MKIRFLFFSVLFLFSLAICSAKPKVVAHRGHWQAEGSAQNSIRSLIKADSIGCYACEFDVWITSDDVLVVNHNADINGLVIENEKSDKLLKCKLSNGENLSTLNAFLDTAKVLNLKLVLELKPHVDKIRENLAVDKIIEMVKEKGLEDRIIYISFSRNALERFVSKSDCPTFFLTGVDINELKAMGATGADYHINVFRKKNPTWIKEFKAAGIPINVWTVNEPEDIKWSIDNDVDYITTNFPERTFEMLKKSQK